MPEPLFIGTARRCAVDATTDGKHVRLHLEFRKTPQAAPIEFVLSARMAMVLAATLQELRSRHGWPGPTPGAASGQA